MTRVLRGLGRLDVSYSRLPCGGQYLALGCPPSKRTNGASSDCGAPPLAHIGGTMPPISANLRRLGRRPLTVVVVLAVLVAVAWAVAQPPLQLAANCAGGGYGGSGYGGYGAPTGTCGPYPPLPPTRILDTRIGTGGVPGPVGPGQTAVLTIAGANGVPAMPGASAVVLNVTVTDTSEGSLLTVWPDGQAQPTA